MKRKTLLTVPFATLAVLAIPTIAAAHIATASGTCQQGVSWSATNYEQSATNTITVTIDGVIRHQDLDFKASDTGTLVTAKTVPHTWSVVVNAPGATHDKNLSGSYPACETAPTTVAPSTTVGTTTTTASTDTSPLPTVVTDPTTTVVAVDIPPVPSAPPSSLLDVVSLTPAEPVLPVTGLDGTIILVAAILVIGGVFLVLRGRRVQ